MTQADIPVTIPTYTYVGSSNPVGPIHHYRRTPRAISSALAPPDGVLSCRHRFMSAALLPGWLTLATHPTGPAPGSSCRISTATSALPGSPSTGIQAAKMLQNDIAYVGWLGYPGRPTLRSSAQADIRSTPPPHDRHSCPPMA